MPTGKHKAVLDGMKTTVAAINGGPTYNYDLTGTGQVGLRLPVTAGDFEVEVWIHAGVDEWGQGNISPRNFDVFFNILVTGFIAYHDEGETLTEAIELLRYDVLKAVLASPNLGGTCTDVMPLRASEVAMDTNRQRAEIDFEFVAKLTEVAAATL